ncbi:MAG: VPLPA-CTERM sorting domain-containing protein [Gammaproteobacteria bacterium]
MNKRFSKSLLGAVALLGSSLSYGATVTLTVQENSGIANDGLVNVGDSFSILVSGSGFPETAGATLLLNFNSLVASVKTPTITNGIVLAGGSPFTGGVIANNPHLSGDQFTFLAGNPPAALPQGSFNAVLINFNALALGFANVTLTDDGLDNVWTDANTFEPIPVTYNYANASVQVIPVPAAAWLFVSAIGGLAALKRRQG